MQNISSGRTMNDKISAQSLQADGPSLGCLVLKCPFYYLGTRVGGSMTRVQAWQEIVEKVKSRLSKWKSKTLSIGSKNDFGLNGNNVLTDTNEGASLYTLESSKDVTVSSSEVTRVWSAPFWRIPRGGGYISNNQLTACLELVRGIFSDGLCSLDVSMRYALPNFGENRGNKVCNDKINVLAWEIKDDALHYDRFNISRRGIDIRICRVYL
ncbi:hypothetical protein Tco_0873224 [Tanacetum coccineum]